MLSLVYILSSKQQATYIILDLLTLKVGTEMIYYDILDTKVGTIGYLMIVCLIIGS